MLSYPDSYPRLLALTGIYALTLELQLHTSSALEIDSFRVANLQPGFEDAVDEMCRDIDDWARQCGSSTPQCAFDGSTLTMLLNAAKPAGKAYLMTETCVILVVFV